MSASGTAPVFARSSPGTYVVICEPGEKPSARFQSVGSIGLPATLRGIDVRSNATRRPVGVERSAFVKKSFGNGSMHADASIGSHAADATLWGLSLELRRSDRTRPTQLQGQSPQLHRGRPRSPGGFASAWKPRRAAHRK